MEMPYTVYSINRQNPADPAAAELAQRRWRLQFATQFLPGLFKLAQVSAIPTAPSNAKRNTPASSGESARSPQSDVCKHHSALYAPHMRRWAAQITPIEKSVACLTGFLLVGMCQFAFSGAAHLLTAAILAALLAASSKRLLFAKVWCLLSVACGVGGFLELRESQPLRQRIVGRSFNDEPATEVLQFRASQKTTSPSWNFSVYGAELANNRVSVDFPDDATLGEALQLLSEEMDCDYGYRWSKSCGNATTPSAARFWISREGATTRRPRDADVLVYADTTCFPKSLGSSPPSSAPPSLPAANP